MNLVKNEVFESFTNRMAQELDDNSRKGDWMKFKDKELIKKEIKYHLEKLNNPKSTDNELELSADIANLALFYFNAVKNPNITKK